MSRTDNRRRSEGIHPYSLGLTVLIDNALLVQRNLVGQDRGRSITYAFLLGAVAGIPTSFFGTATGGALLLKAGLGRLFGGRQEEQVR